MRSGITFKKVLLFVSIVLLIFLARPVVFLLNQYYSDKNVAVTKKPGYTNDARLIEYYTA